MDVKMAIREKLLCSISSIILSTILVSTFHVQASDPNQMLASKKMDFILLKAYSESYQFYRKVNLYEVRNEGDDDELSDGLSCISGFAKRFQSHCAYALNLARGCTSLTELFTALYVKFLSFMNGVNYLNCAIYRGHGPVLTEDYCRETALHFLWFSELGFEEIAESELYGITIEGILVLMANQHIPNENIKPTIERLIDGMNSYRETFLLSRQMSAENITYYNRERNESFYNNLRSRQDSVVELATTGMRKLFESIKFGTPFSSEHYKERVIPDFDLAQDLWDRAYPAVAEKMDIAAYNHDEPFFMESPYEIEVELFITEAIYQSEIQKLKAAKINDKAVDENFSNIDEYAFQLYFNKQHDGRIENSVYYSSISSSRYQTNFNFRKNLLKDPNMRVETPESLLSIETVQKVDKTSLEQSKRMDFRFLNVYKKQFSVYQRKSPSLSKDFMKEINYKLQEKRRNQNEYNGILYDHYVHALKLAKDSTSLTDLFVAIYVKFLAFVNGVNFLNCTVYDGVVTTGKFLSMSYFHSCHQVAYDFLWFSDLGFEELVERISVLMASEAPNISNVIQDIVQPMKTFMATNLSNKGLTDYTSAFFKRPRNEAEVRLWRYSYSTFPLPRHNILPSRQLDNAYKLTELYHDLCTEEQKTIGLVTDKMKELFEFIKFGADFAYLRYHEVLTPELKLAEHLWGRAWKIKRKLRSSYELGDHNITEAIRQSEIHKLQLYLITTENEEDEVEFQDKNTDSLQLYFDMKNGVVENNIFHTSQTSRMYQNNLIFRKLLLQDPHIIHSDIVSV